MNNPPVRWNSSLSFIFATAAAAIGLGNIWRFPFVVGHHGGGTFVLLYLICVFTLGIPLLLAEVAIGRLGRKTPPEALSQIAQSSGHSKRWSWLGMLAILCTFLITTYYSVITGWVINYFLKACFNQFQSLTETSSIAMFTQLKQHSGSMILSDTVVIVLAAIVVSLGIKKGLERLVLWLFPAMFLLLIILAIYSCATGDCLHTLHYLFDFHPEDFTFRILLMALGQAFFSLSIAMGINIMMGSYLPESTNLITATIWVAIADTAFALLAGLIIFPIVFTHHLSVTAGPSLIFQSLPIAFSHMPFGLVFAVFFFILLFFAAFSSVVALFEVTITTLTDLFRCHRKTTLIYTVLIWWGLSLLTIGSFSHPSIFSAFGKTWFDLIDTFTAAILIPALGILIALFAGWVLSNTQLEQLGWNIHSFWYRLWRLVLRYIAPLVIGMILFGIN
ncbi:MAG: sodium-dependent transporter [Coxiellaceae bacterium]|nr:sodium-dependent transporter [Coxiellaceae bacterium]|tara:strand:+ start:2232 stop:3572 length:1341 start_codon:yes stop_codon:yes gene_type:complete